MHHGVTSAWVVYLHKALWVLAGHFGATSLEGLLGIVVDWHLYSQYEQPVGSRHQLMMPLWAQNDGSMPHVNHYDMIPPNNVACLIDRSVMRCMVMAAPTCVVEETCNLRIDVQGSANPARPEMVFLADSHVHIDRVFQRQWYRSWQDFEDRRGREFASRIRFDEVVYSANFPDTCDWVERALDRRCTYLTVGLHPHVCSEVIPERVMRRGVQLLRDPRCVGVGEVGLDYYHHTQERERSLQRSYLHTLLPQVASTSKPLVIHCREHSIESSQCAWVLWCQEPVDRGVPPGRLRIGKNPPVINSPTGIGG